MNRTIRWVFGLLALSIFIWTAWLGSQQPRLSLNAEHFGLALVKGGYRSYFLSWSDGQMPVYKQTFVEGPFHQDFPDKPGPRPQDFVKYTNVGNTVVTGIWITNIYLTNSPIQTPVWRSVVISDDGATYRFGYRWWPKFQHVDLRPLLKTKETQSP